MCTMVYLASDSPLPAVAWDEEKPVFAVGEVGRLADAERGLRAHLTKSYVHYVASDKEYGCGCNFHYGVCPTVDDDDLAREQLCRESVKRLREYLAEVVERGPVELYAAWHGGPGTRPASPRKAEVTPDYFGGDSFEFSRADLLIVRSAKSRTISADS